MPTVGLVTCGRLPDLDPDDRPLLPALARRGISARAVVWNDRAVRWTDFDLLVLRSVWDYHLHDEAFLSWIDGVEKAGVALSNSPAVVRENAHKFYLRELETAGIPILPTEWVERGSVVALPELLDRRGWETAVVKPAVSASAYRTLRVSRRSAGGEQAFLDSLLADGDVLVQEFAPEVTEPGEWSLVFLGGAYSHAVRKIPAPGDFRVQHELGGRAVAGDPSGELVRGAAAALRRAAPRSLYARVDGIEREGALVVIELELIEPSLFLRHAAGAAERFADAIAGAAKEKPPSPRLDGNGLRLRAANRDDAPAIARVLSDAFAEHEPSYTPGGFAATTPPPEVVADRLSEGPIFVVVDGERVVGTVSLVVRAEGLYVRGMAVASAARGLGIGERLLERAEAFAVENRCRRLYLDTTPFLTRAIRLYERWGFHRSNAARHDLFGTPLFTMVKEIDPAGSRGRNRERKKFS